MYETLTLVSRSEKLVSFHVDYAIKPLSADVTKNNRYNIHAIILPIRPEIAHPANLRKTLHNRALKVVLYKQSIYFSREEFHVCSVKHK